MGRWAQSRRRGGRAAGASLPAPPAPDVELLGGTTIASVSELVANTGGTLQLWYGGYPDGPGTMFTEVGWIELYEWGDPEDLPRNWLRARATGNGVAFSGASAWSNWYDNTGA